MTHDLRLTTLIDTHTHLYEEQFDTDRTEMIERAINTGVSKMIIPNVDSTTIKGMMDLVQQYHSQLTTHDSRLNLLPLVKLASICIGTNLL